MLDPLDYDNRPYLDALARKRRNAYFAVFIERVCIHFWRFFFWGVFFCGLWMLGLPALFGRGGEITASAVFLLGTIYFLKKDILRFKLPDSSALDARIESRNALLRGHISVLEDKIANPKKAMTRLLWGYFEQQILETFKKLKSPYPRALLTRRDPFALRFLAILFFISGLAVSGSQWSERITDGMFAIAPQLSAGAKAQNISLWITPPEYTGLAQTYLSGKDTISAPLQIPDGSEIKLRVKVPFGDLVAPRFFNGNSRIKMSYLGDNLYGYEGAILDGDMLKINYLLIPRARWPYVFIKDTPPEISFAKEKQSEEKTEEKAELYEIMEDYKLRFALSMVDDYSVEKLSAHLALDPMIEDKPIGNDFHDERLVMSPPNVRFKADPVYDLTWHTWAGLPVTMTFTAHDHLGQTGQTQTLSFVLPERPFEHPIAKSMIRARKTLAWNYQDSFHTIVNDLSSLLNAPDFFNHDPVIYLALRTAAVRLALAENRPQVERTQAAADIIKLLWAVAIAIEDGDIAHAMQELRQAQRDLERAVQDPDSTEQEIARLMDNLQEKMQNYMAELQREMQKRMENGEQIPSLPEDFSGTMITPDMMEKMMQDLLSAMQSGDKDKAQDMLSKLQRMMDMMDQPMSMNMPQDMQMMQDGINELQELIKKQEALLDQTRDDVQTQSRSDYAPFIQPDMEILRELGIENIPPPPLAQPQTEQQERGAQSENAAEEQKALRYILGQLMKEAGSKLDEIPPNMGMAELEMRESENALSAGEPQISIPHQEEAIKHLKDAQQDLAQKLQARMQMMIGFGMQAPQRFDPLGRPYGGQDGNHPNSDQSDVKIPNDAQKKRVDEILELLRRRSGEFSRPEEEREYYRRLLRQF